MVQAPFSACTFSEVDVRAKRKVSCNAALKQENWELLSFCEIHCYFQKHTARIDFLLAERELAFDDKHGVDD